MDGEIGVGGRESDTIHEFLLFRISEIPEETFIVVSPLPPPRPFRMPMNILPLIEPLAPLLV